MTSLPAGLRGACWITAVATVLTVALAWPVLTHPATRLFGAEIVGRHHDPFTVIAQFEQPIVLGLQTQPITDFAGALLARLVGAVPAYNLIILATFPLATFFTYLFAYRLTGNAAASSVAAFAFAFSPFHIAHAAYHPHIAQIQWIPLYLLALWRCLDRFSAARSAVLLFSAVLVAMSNFYGGYIAALLTPVAIAGHWWQSRATSNALKTTTVLGAVGLSGFAYVARFAPWVLFDRHMVSFPQDDLARYGAQWWSYFVPPVGHPLLGGLASRVMAQGGVSEGLLEQQLAIGFALLLLTVIAGAYWIGRRPTAQAVSSRLTTAVPAVALLGLAAYVLSLAPGQTLGSLRVPSVSTALYAIAPMFRSYARFGAVVELAVAILAGIGFACLWSRPARTARFAGLALAGLACIELFVVPPSRDVLPTQAHRWLASQPAGLNVLDLAASNQADWSVPRLVGQRLTFLSQNVAELWEPDLAAKLAGLGFTHVVYRRPSAASEWLDHAPLPAGLRMLQSLPDGVVLAVDAPPPIVFTRRIDGFYPREHRDASSWQWMASDGMWSVMNASGEPQTVVLDLEAEAFGKARVIAIALNGQSLSPLRVPVDRGWLHVGPLNLITGLNILTFHAAEPPVVADELAHNGDRRLVSIAVWDWKWTELMSPGAHP